MLLIIISNYCHPQIILIMFFHHFNKSSSNSFSEKS